MGQSLSFEQLEAHPKHLVGPKKVLNGEYPPRQLEGYHVYYNYRPLVETVPVLRFYNRSTQQYAYVRHASEIARLKSSGWRSEGVAWKSFPNGEYSSYREKLHGDNRGTLVGPVFIQVYRLWNRKTGEYIFTRHWQEIRFLMTHGWKYEGIAFCSQLNDQSIYRLYNSKTDRYFFTARQEEVKKLQATNVWKNEGIAFFSRP